MATRKDHVEADDWNRRRLLTAFARGSGGDLEDYPRRPNRMLYAGLALVLLVGVTVGVRTYLQDLPPRSWLDDGTLVVDEVSGARYVARDRVLVPVPNLTSARLLGASDLDPVEVAPRLIGEAERAAPTGVPGAPDAVPEIDALPLLACATAGDEVVVQVGPGDPPGDPSEGALVQAPDGALWLATAGRRHRLADTAATALGYLPSEARPVPTAWLALVPEGVVLRPFAPGGDLVRDGLTGEHFLLAGGRARPVADQTTRLLIAKDRRTVPHGEVVAARTGPQVGIEGAPPVPPDVPSSGVDATPCASTRGETVSAADGPDLTGQQQVEYRLDELRVRASSEPGAGAMLSIPARDPDAAPGQRELFLVADGVVHRLEDAAVLSALVYEEEEAEPVGREIAAGWLALFRDGPRLRRFE